MKRILYQLLCVIVFFSATSSVYANKDTDYLRKQFVDELLVGPVNNDRVAELLNTLQPDGTWPGIDYVDTSRVAFQHTIHLNNMFLLAKAYKRPGNKYKGNKKVFKALNSSLNFWLKHDFICENWWNNQIGTPTTMVNIMLLIDKELTPAQVEKLLVIVGRANINATGARPSGDRIRIAGIQACCALFKRDDVELEELLKVIEGEMKFSRERGIQYDYSFHHRTDWVNNTLTYGENITETFVDWAYKLSKTRYHFSQNTIQMMVDYYLDGICKQMVYGKIMDPGILNRDIIRKGTSTVKGTELVKKLLAVTDYRKTELDNVVKAREGEEVTPISFAKFFWNTDHFVYQRPNYYTSVRMYSSRRANMEEPYNGEGEKNHYRGDGTNYLSLTGKEYAEITPCFDWMRIPGATTVILDEMPPANEIQKWGIKDYAGAVTDGMYGAAAMDFVSPHTMLSAKKAWFFFDKEYVCLGTDIRNRMDKPAVTTLNQCYLEGDVYVNDAAGTHLQAKGNSNLSSVNWVFHNNVGYYFPGKASVSLKNVEVIGNWGIASSRRFADRTPVKSDIFALWFNHRPKAGDDSYQYIVVPAVDRNTMDQYQNPITIIANNAKIQAVRNDKEGIAYCVFYQGGDVKLTNQISLSVDTPCMLMIQYDANGKVQKMYASDPTQGQKRLYLALNGRDLKVEIPQEQFAGKSVSVNL